MKYTFAAIFAPDDDAFNVRFPDLPECLTFGIGLEDAKKMAEDVLGLILYDKEEDGVAIPEPSKEIAVADEKEFVVWITCDTDEQRRFFLNQKHNQTDRFYRKAWYRREAPPPKTVSQDGKIKEVCSLKPLKLV